MSETNQNTQQAQEKEHTKKAKQKRKSEAPKKEDNQPKPQEVDDSYIRLLAEFENLKKRQEKEQQYLLTHIKKKFFMNLIPVLDDFDLALKHRGGQETKDDETGMILIRKKIIQLLEKEGLKAMKVDIGAPFDTKSHEALTTLSSDDPAKKDTIAEVVNQGYVLDYEIIRPAKVIVYA